VTETVKDSGASASKIHQTLKGRKKPQEKLTRKSLSLQDRIKILDRLDSLPPNTKCPELLQEYGLCPRIITSLRKEEKHLREIAKKGVNLERKRMRNGQHPEIEQALAEWYFMQATAGALSGPLGPIIKAKAQEMAKAKGATFSASTGWFCRWKDRYGITNKKRKKRTNSDMLATNTGKAARLNSGTGDSDRCITDSLADQASDYSSIITGVAARFKSGNGNNESCINDSVPDQGSGYSDEDVYSIEENRSENEVAEDNVELNGQAACESSSCDFVAETAEQNTQEHCENNPNVTLKCEPSSPPHSFPCPESMVSNPAQNFPQDTAFACPDNCQQNSGSEEQGESKIVSHQRAKECVALLYQYAAQRNLGDAFMSNLDTVCLKVHRNAAMDGIV
jgi:hypothetical protein